MDRRAGGPRGGGSQDAQYTRAKFDFKGFLSLIRQTKPKYWQLWLGLILGFIATGAQLAVPKMAQGIINGLKSGFNSTLLIIAVVLFLASALINALSGTMLGFFGENIVARLRRTLWQKLIRLHVNYFDNVKAGEMTSRLVNDSTQIKDLLANAFPQMANSLLQLVGALIIMALMDWKMTLVMIIAIPLVMIVMRPIMRQSSKIGLQRQDALASFNGETGESLGEIRLVKSSNA